MTCSHLHCSRPEPQVNHCSHQASQKTSAHAGSLVDMSGTAPGKRCPTCEAKGQEVWVLPGRDCGYCGTYVS
ncbi:hypothetical protein GGR54DRAFT_217202 [Hypoxylon sp. NC1633]|nr:hypothetical protein GGR54DRAFT_217202 [Hypoxylon sp. NC1633]